MTTKRIYPLCAFGLMLTMVLGTASAEEFYAIATNFGTSKKASAWMDVSVDPILGQGIGVQFNVYNASGGQIAEFTSFANSNGFATSNAVSTNDFFKLSNGEPTLVRARTPSGAPTLAAALHESGRGTDIDLAVLPSRRRDGTIFAMGTTFAIALGNVTGTLLIGNVSGSDVGVDVYRGSQGAVNSGIYTTPKLSTNALWRVDLADTEKNANIVVHASGLIIMQLILNDGQRLSALTCMPAQ